LVGVIENNQNKIDWYYISLNTNPNVFKLIEKNKDKINWYLLATNPNLNIINFLEKNKNKVDWYCLCGNPGIFELDYKAMKINNEMMEEELIKEIMKPSRVFKDPSYDYIELLFDD
jgi:hypothetical protein